MFDNGYYFTGYAKDTTVRARLRLDEGAPLMEGSECVLEDGLAEYSLPKCLHKRCRFFADQDARSVVSVMRRTAEHPSMDERFLITGLRDATLTVRPPRGGPGAHGGRGKGWPHVRPEQCGNGMGPGRQDGYGQAPDRVVLCFLAVGSQPGLACSGRISFIPKKSQRRFGKTKGVVSS